MRKILFVFCLFASFISYAQVACRCNCAIDVKSLCASSYDLEHPCNGLCPMQPGSEFMQPGKTTCPVNKIYNPDKAMFEWIVMCPDR